MVIICTAVCDSVKQPHDEMAGVGSRDHIGAKEKENRS